MNEIIRIIFETAAGIFSLIGAGFCIYYIFFRKKLYINGSVYLVLDIDETDERLEYYIRGIQNGNIKINKIILNSKSDMNQETLNICGLLSRDYPNVSFYSGGNIINNIINLEKIAGE